jgi:integrase
MRRGTSPGPNVRFASTSTVADVALDEKTAKAVGLTLSRPYDLRHAFVSLLLAEGRTVVDIAAQAGHSPTMTLDTYGHAIDELDPAQGRSAEELINEAREAGVRILCAREAELAEATAAERRKPPR